jgi:hypothetical protein
LWKEAGIADCDEFLGYVELLPEDSSALELIEQLGSGLTLLPSSQVGRRREKSYGNTKMGDHLSESVIHGGC